MFAANYWRSKPPAGVRINAKHDNAQDLLRAYTLQEGNGTPREHLLGEVSTPQTGLSWGGGLYGRGLTFAGGATQYVQFPAVPQIVSAASFSCVAWFRSATTAQINVTPWSARQSATNYQFHLKTDGSGHMRGLVYTSVTGEVVASDPATIDTLWHCWAVTYDGATARLWRDGNQVASVAATAALGNGATHKIEIGSDQAGSDLWIGDFAQGLLYSVALPKERLQRISPDPFGMFYPPTWRRYAIPQATTTFGWWPQLSVPYPERPGVVAY